MGVSRSVIGFDISGFDVFVVNDGVWVGKRSLGYFVDSFVVSGVFFIFFVGGEVEGDEEEEVRVENIDIGEGSKFFICVFVGGGYLGLVSWSEVSVWCEVDEVFDVKLVILIKEDWERLWFEFIKINDELDNLEMGDLFFLLDFDVMCVLEVVLVYDDVDEEVEVDDNLWDGSGIDELGVVEESGSVVVVVVKEGERFFFEE